MLSSGNVGMVDLHFLALTIGLVGYGKLGNLSVSRGDLLNRSKVIGSPYGCES